MRDGESSVRWRGGPSGGLGIVEVVATVVVRGVKVGLDEEENDGGLLRRSAIVRMPARRVGGRGDRVFVLVVGAAGECRPEWERGEG